ncbi:MAG: hypothetical protein E6Q97_16590 [Desulfurellales bacterium]|nr:MAG: hypothetical protein E6Q97_16590 [Desulfurellales bacterium]
MIAIEDIQSTIGAAISAHSYLSGIAVIEDDGLKAHDIEEALGDDGNGVAIVVCLPLGGDPADNAKNLLSDIVTVAVEVRVNVERNSAAGGAGKSVLLLLKAVREAVAGWSPENRGSRPFRSAGFSEPDLFEGEVSYVAMFTVQTAHQLAAA